MVAPSLLDELLRDHISSREKDLLGSANIRQICLTSDV
jgi:hypothetical protein